MPYIDKYDRPEIKAIIDRLFEQKPPLLDVEGECNFAITYLLHKYLDLKGVRYHNLNSVVGILECAKLEFYAMMARPYEDGKIREHGFVGVLPELEGK